MHQVVTLGAALGMFNWMSSFLTEFVQVTASVKAPLKVELERRIRIYAQQDINQLLKAESVNLLDLLPDIAKCDGFGNDESVIGLTDIILFPRSIMFDHANICS